MRTLILHHADCLEHIVDDTHQEAPARYCPARFFLIFFWKSDQIVFLYRMHAIMKRISCPKMFSSVELDITDQFEVASYKDIARAHSKEYIDFLHRLQKQVASTAMLLHSAVI